MSEDKTPRKAKRSWEHIPERFARGPWVCKSNKQETHMVFESDWVNPFSSRCTNFSWPGGDSSFLSHVKVKQASPMRPRITHRIVGKGNLLKFSCWLWELSPGTICFQRKRNCYRPMHFSLPCCSSDLKQIWIGCIIYLRVKRKDTLLWTHFCSASWDGCLKVFRHLVTEQKPAPKDSGDYGHIYVLVQLRVAHLNWISQA